jgi:hypothetical protein
VSSSAQDDGFQEEKNMKKYRLIPNLMLSAVLAASAVSPVQAAGKSPAEFDQWMED